MQLALVTAPIFASFCLLLGLFVFLKNPRGRSNVYFALLNVALVVWCFDDIIIIEDHRLALTLYRLWYVGGSFIPYFAPAFVWTVADCRRPKAERLLLGLSILFAVVSPTGLLIRDIVIHSHPWAPIEEIGGCLYYPFALFFVGGLSYCLIPLFDAYRRSTGEVHQQRRYLMAAVAFGILGVMDFVATQFGSRVPALFYLLEMAVSANFAAAIVKHHLMDIRVVIRKTLVYSSITAVLTALYVLITVGLAWLLGGRVVSPSIYSSAAGACAMALLFHPLRMKVQGFVDRHFFRESLDQAILREATSGFVHEIKRPLAKISLPAELSLMDLQDVTAGRRSSGEVLPKVMERLQFILDQTSDAGNKIEAIHDVSTLDGKPPEQINLNLIVKLGVDTERELLDRHHVQVDLDLADNLPALRGHARQLEIVVSNLVKNAAEALGTLPPVAPRKISILTSAGGSQIILEVKDSGPGIKDKDRRHLFEPYFTTKGAKGTGMGLFLCHQIVQAHGGSLRALANTPNGATFQVVLAQG